MAINDLIVKPASEAQTREVILRNAAQWGAKAGIAVEDFVKLNAIFQTGDYARNARLTIWVLVPANDTDTTDFYSSCQTFTREVQILHPGQTTPVSEFGHAISAVLTHPRHRGKGCGKRFMSLLHAALAPQRYPGLRNSVTPTHPPSTVSVLYSSVGEFYASCVPAPGESGWTSQRSMKTVWTLSAISDIPAEASRSTVPLLSESEITSLLSADDRNIPADLLELQKSDPTKTYFAFAPTAPLNAFSLTLSKLSPGCPTNVPWGARVSDGGDFMTWVYETRTSRKLVITRLRADINSFPALFGAALAAARETNREIIEMWNVPQELLGIVRATGGETIERKELLSAFKWYGTGSASNKDIVWALDERYGWC